MNHDMRSRGRKLFNNMSDVLDSDNKAYDEVDCNSGGILASLIRKIYLRLDIKPNQFHRLALSFINDPANGYSIDTKIKMTNKGNITKELFARSISWKVFIKGIKFLQFKKFMITVTLIKQNNQMLHCSTDYINIDRRSDLTDLMSKEQLFSEYVGLVRKKKFRNKRKNHK